MSRRRAFRTCPLCEACCGLELTLDGERVELIRGDREDPFSAGFICPKGSALGHLHEDPDRLHLPLLAVDGAHRAVSWEEAFAEVERRLTPLLSEHGRDCVAVYLGNPTVHSFEASIAVRPLVKAIGTRNLFTAATVDQMPKHVSSGYLFGHPLAIPVPDLDRTSYLMILGANPLESNGSLATAPDWPGRLRRLRRRGGKLVVVDPRRTRTAQDADLHVPIRPGTDAALLLGMVRALFAADRVRLGRLEGSVVGVEEVAEASLPFEPSAVEAYTGVPAALVERLALDLAGAESAAVYGRIGTHTTAFGTVAAWAVDVLNILTGNLDRPGGAMFARAAHDPAYRRRRAFRPGRWTSRVRRLPEVLGELPVATLVDEIETPGEGQVRALVTVAGNPVLTTPDAARLDAALASLELVVAVDPYLNETTRHADVILPPPSPLERAHYDIAFPRLSVRNFVRYSPPVFPLPEGSPSEFEILVRLTAIAAGLGAGTDVDVLAGATLTRLVETAVGDPRSSIHGRRTDEILAALAGRPMAERFVDLMLRTGHGGDAFGASPDGLSLEKLEGHPHGMDLGALQPCLPDCLGTPSGKVELAADPILAEVKRLAGSLGASPAAGLVLVGRRQLRTANSWTHNISVLVRGHEACTLEIHPVDASRLRLADGDRARVRSQTGEVVVPVEITPGIARGVVSLPYGWGHDLAGSQLSVASNRPGVNLNRLTDGADVDPLSGTAVLNGVAVVVEPVSSSAPVPP